MARKMGVMVARGVMLLIVLETCCNGNILVFGVRRDGQVDQSRYPMAISKGMYFKIDPFSLSSICHGRILE